MTLWNVLLILHGDMEIQRMVQESVRVKCLPNPPKAKLLTQ